MYDPNGWPDAERPGVPLNPERDGDHMMAVTDEHGRVWHEVWKWKATSKPQVWMRPNPTGGPYGYEARHLEAPCYSFIRYLGPCLTPQEVAARVAEARAEALEEAAQEAGDVSLLIPPKRLDAAGQAAFGDGYAVARNAIVAAIRALKEASRD